MTQIEVYASSSAGNAYCLTFDSEGTKPIDLIIETGIEYSSFKNTLCHYGHFMGAIKGALVTHDHRDHYKCSNSLYREYGIKTYGNELVATDALCVLREHAPVEIYPSVIVYPFGVKHDAKDSLGFMIMHNEEKVLFVNDCKYFEANLTSIQFDYIMIECNYIQKKVKMLLEKSKTNGKGADLKRYKRIVDAHMGDDDCLMILKQFDLSKTKAIFLMHLSDANSDEHEFKRRFSKELNFKNVYVCKKNGGIM